MAVISVSGLGKIDVPNQVRVDPCFLVLSVLKTQNTVWPLKKLTPRCAKSPKTNTVFVKHILIFVQHRDVDIML